MTILVINPAGLPPKNALFCLRVPQAERMTIEALKLFRRVKKITLGYFAANSVDKK